MKTIISYYKAIIADLSEGGDLNHIYIEQPFYLKCEVMIQWANYIHRNINRIVTILLERIVRLRMDVLCFQRFNEPSPVLTGGRL